MAQIVLNSEVFAHFTTLRWFANCGTNRSGEFRFPVAQVSQRNAIASAQSDHWTDIKDEAQGDLTSYLAKNHYYAYGGVWNRLAGAADERLRQEVMPHVRAGLKAVGAEELCDLVLTDLTRISLYETYRGRFKHVPVFFGVLLAVYESGHLPCDWRGDLDAWPEGQLLIY